MLRAGPAEAHAALLQSIHRGTDAARSGAGSSRMSSPPPHGRRNRLRDPRSIADLRRCARIHPMLAALRDIRRSGCRRSDPSARTASCAPSFREKLPSIPDDRTQGLSRFARGVQCSVMVLAGWACRAASASISRACTPARGRASSDNRTAAHRRRCRSHSGDRGGAAAHLQFADPLGGSGWLPDRVPRP